MTKKRILLLIPILLISGLIINCWTVIFTSGITENWRHKLALFLYLIIIALYFTNFRLAVLGTLTFLILATFNILLLSPDLNRYWIEIGSLKTPPIELKSFGLLILFCILNYFTLIDVYIDYKEGPEENENNV